jgi:hypothetical protein
VFWLDPSAALGIPRAVASRLTMLVAAYVVLVSAGAQECDPDPDCVQAVQLPCACHCCSLRCHMAITSLARDCGTSIVLIDDLGLLSRLVVHAYSIGMCRRILPYAICSYEMLFRLVEATLQHN